MSAAGMLTTLMVVGVALYKWFQLSEGGGRWLAKSLGGTMVRPEDADEGHRRALNVVVCPDTHEHFMELLREEIRDMERELGN